jgi:hypothetical protein
MNSWKEDARFVGAFVRGGDWEVGLRIARNVEIGAGEGGEPARSRRISLEAFANEAGIDRKTVTKYLAAWEWAADAGLVDHAADLNPDDSYDFEAAGFSADQWQDYYHVACQNPPPWNPQGKPLEPRKGTDHVSKEQVAEAIESDPAIALAAREAIEKRDAQYKLEQGKRDDKVTDSSPMTDLVRIVMEFRKIKRALHDVLGLVTDLDFDEARRKGVLGNVSHIQQYLDAITQATKSNSIDTEYTQLLDDELQ